MSLQEANKIIENARDKNLKELDLSGLGLTEIPDEVSTLTQLTNLNLSGNKISEIKGLEQLTQLTYLTLSSNQISEIKGLQQLTQLTSLDLSSNQITEIKGLQQLTLLTHLQLSSNQIIEIKGLEQLTLLTNINLAHNQITKITGLDNLIQLTKIDFTKNQIAEIKGLKKLTQIEELYLDANQLIELPKFLLKFDIPFHWTEISMIPGIHIEDNPFTTPPPEIIQQGNEAIREYFTQKEESGEELLKEAKLILLGDGRSGKTSLANRLVGKPLPEEEDRTQGVDIIIGEYQFPLADGSNFKLNIWDFAGQDKYKTLHQLFYTESSLYVMVAESGNTGTDFDDWLQTAELFGEGSPLIVVLNEFKEGIGMGSFDSGYWKGQFPYLLKEVFTSNLKTKTNLPEVKNFIEYLAQRLPHVNYPFPSNWAAIRRVLNERRDEQFITLQEYLKICRENNLPERDSALILSSVLHKIGGCLHYQQSELLSQFIILKNEWATEAVYKILDDKTVAEDNCGFFNKADTQRIWASDEYRDMRPQLLDLMQQFKLAYQLPGKDEYVTPPLLPPARPGHFKWEAEDFIELYIEYEFLPKALMTQFIVSRHIDIAEGRTLVWRNGAILKWDDAMAEVSKTKVEGRDAIYIKSSGTNRKGMMTVILKTFRELHTEYKGIKYKEKVPCTCQGCRTKANKQHAYDYAYLKRRLENGKLNVECNESLDELEVLALLENNFLFEKMKQNRPLTLKANIAHKVSTELKYLKIFLASSSELENERKAIHRMLSNKNDDLVRKGIYIKLIIWEDGQIVGKSFRSQDNYNLEVEQCDLFTMLFYSKVGKFSLEEFDKAKTKFDAGGKPSLLIFRKDINLPKNQSKQDADSRFAFIEKLKKQEHFPTRFQNEEGLINKLETAIDALLADPSFTSLLSEE